MFGQFQGISLRGVIVLLPLDVADDFDDTNRVHSLKARLRSSDPRSNNKYVYVLTFDASIAHEFRLDIWLSLHWALGEQKQKQIQEWKWRKNCAENTSRL